MMHGQFHTTSFSQVLAHLSTHPSQTARIYNHTCATVEYPVQVSTVAFTIIKHKLEIKTAAAESIH